MPLMLWDTQPQGSWKLSGPTHVPLASFFLGSGSQAFSRFFNLLGCCLSVVKLQAIDAPKVSRKSFLLHVITNHHCG